MRMTMGRILDWDFDQIIVGHGAVVENNGKGDSEAGQGRRVF